jgi:hypothetical protein
MIKPRDSLQRPRRSFFILAATAALFAPALAAQERLAAPSWIEKLPVTLSQTDVQRFSRFEDNRKSAIHEAEQGGDPAERPVLRKVLAGEPQAIADRELIGEWRCRTLKLGGNLPLVIYGFFKCRIFEENGALILQKTTGSQRTRGALHRIAPDRFAYIGAGTVNDDPARAYGDAAQEDEVALLVKAAPARLRLEFPAPHYESHFNIIELIR